LESKTVNAGDRNVMINVTGDFDIGSKTLGAWQIVIDYDPAIIESWWVNWTDSVSLTTYAHMPGDTYSGIMGPGAIWITDPGPTSGSYLLCRLMLNISPDAPDSISELRIIKNYSNMVTKFSVYDDTGFFPMVHDGYLNIGDVEFNLATRISEPTPKDETIVPIDFSELHILIEDPDGDLFDWSIETLPDVGGNSGIGDSNGTKVCSISNLEYEKNYKWYVNATDLRSGQISNAVFEFSTEEKPNEPPIIFNEIPINNSINVPITLSFLSVDIEDPEGVLIKWSITTDPYIGEVPIKTYSEGFGTKNCSVFGLEYDTTYTWTVYARDHWPMLSNEKIFTFTTESAPPNQPVEFTNENPAHGTTNLPIDLPEVYITVEDPEGDSFTWEIETSPNIGSSSGSGVNGDRITCATNTVLEYGTTYTWTVHATDTGSGEESIKVNSFTTESAPTQNHPPNKPTIKGKTEVKEGEEAEYTIQSVDPDGDVITLWIDWGDGDKEDWIGPYDSGVNIKINHTWEAKGDYTIKVKAKDPSEEESTIGSLNVKVPNQVTSLVIQLLQILSERFSIFKLLLEYLNVL